MTKILAGALLALALLMPSTAKAAGETPTFEVGYSSMASVGFRCSTGTVSQINLDRPTNFSMNIAGYRIQNQDGVDSVWIGGVSVSTLPAVVTTANIANLGEQLIAGASAPWAFNKDRSRSTVPTMPIYCLAADAAGAAGAVLSVVWFGY